MCRLNGHHLLYIFGFDRVPATITLKDLLAIYVLCDKYEDARIVQPWLTMWINSLRGITRTAGYEEWLWISWEFGELKIFEEVSTRLTREVCINNSGQCISTSGKVLDPAEGSAYFPPRIIGERAKAIGIKRDKNIP